MSLTATKKLILAPSILSANPLEFGKEISEAEKLGANWHHLDVMDGHFVPNLTFGLPLISAIKKISKIPVDVHIMVTNPDEVAVDYVKAGADILTFHVEAARHAHRLAAAIREAGGKPGLAINPGTTLEKLRPMLPYIDVINVMSVNPGFGGQSFIKESLQRIKDLSDMIKEARLSHEILIEVDGGINDKTGKLCYEAGASVLVAGNYLYGAKDRNTAYKSLRSIEE